MKPKRTEPNFLDPISIIEKSSAANVLFDLDFKIVGANKQFSSLLSLSKNQTLSSRLNVVLRFQDSPEKIKNQLQHLNEDTAGVRCFKATIIGVELNKTGQEVTLLVQHLKTNNEDLFLGIVTQVAASKNQNRPEVSDEHLFKMLLNELPDAIYFKDLLGRFFLTNRLHVKKLGLNSLEQFLGKTDFDLFSHEHAQQAFDDEQQVIKTEETMSKEEKETRLDGTITWASTSKMPLRNESGKIVGTFGISKDITEIKHAEIKLRNAEKILKEANDSKDKFFSILAHDLRNPFNSLIGLSDLLVDEFGDLDEDEKLDMVKKIQQTSESAYILLENLLEWSRVQRGALTVKPELVVVKPMVEEVIELSRLHAFNKKIDIVNAVEDKLTVMADENMLRTILRNLVSNAIKFTNQGGKVLVKSETKDGNFRIIVEDNGVGMDSETLQRLFQISEKVKTYGTNDESGTGLGLIICREFVEKNNGTINVESKEGVGSKFIISLPVG